MEMSKVVCYREYPNIPISKTGIILLHQGGLFYKAGKSESGWIRDF